MGQKLGMREKGGGRERERAEGKCLFAKHCHDLCQGSLVFRLNKETHSMMTNLTW